ncbi:MAG: terminase large subunit [Mollicutes bacterium]|nr:terminase large subunit [Mollicutes bacterium]MCI7084303.1 terminase large subunit [Mycoplasmatota bacterium]
MIQEHPSYIYALKIVNNEISPPKLYFELNGEKKFIPPKYVKKQCQIFVDIADGKSDKYIINEKRVSKIDKILKVLKMAKGLKVGKSIYNSLAGYQWLLIVASLCTVYRSDVKKRRYETVILEICRKNGKTFIVALLILLLFYLEPKYSQFYSVAPDGALAKEIKKALEPLIKTNADIFEEGEFKILRDCIKHLFTDTIYTPLNYSKDRMDGKEPNVFVADEVGALPTDYAIEAMRSGQLLLYNKLGFIISTKYPTFDNPMETEVNYAKKVLDNTLPIPDESVFALLFEPNETKNWTNDDDIILQSNPLAIEIEAVYKSLLDKRTKAIEMESKRENFLTKHCNIIYQGAGTESYIDVNEVQKCRVDKIDWTGREVYLGVDLAMSNDNCAVGMVADDDGTILAEAIDFIPEGRIEEKNQTERINYYEFINALKCIACGDKVVDYSVIENYVFAIEEKYNVTVMGIGSDRFNAMSSAQKWDTKYNVVMVRQHSDTLHAPTKLLYEKIMDRKFKYESNKLLEINFQNAKCVYDTNMNRYIHKKKSNGKVDMVFALLDAIYLLQQESYLENGDFFVQVG